MYNKIITSALLFLFLFSAGNSFSQKNKNTEEPPATYEFKLKDGSVYIGTIVKEDEKIFVIKTNQGNEVTLKKEDVESHKKIEMRKDGSHWFSNPHATRYLFSPSAINLKKGEAYYQNTYLSLQNFNYGITDYISMGGGFELFSLISGYPVVFLQPKASAKIEKDFYVGGGILYANIFDLNGSSDFSDFKGAGFLYGSATYGNSDNNLTMNVGYGFYSYTERSFTQDINGNLITTNKKTVTHLSNSPVITLSGMTRISKGVSFLSENWFVPTGTNSTDIFFSYGMRFMSERMSFDFAFINNKDIIKEFPIPLGIPYIDFVIHFGKK